MLNDTGIYVYGYDNVICTCANLNIRLFDRFNEHFEYISLITLHLYINIGVYIIKIKLQ